MALLQCEICGGKLIMKPGGICECCDCGMGYDKEWIKEQVAAMKHETREGTVDRPTSNNTNEAMGPDVEIDNKGALDKVQRGKISVRDRMIVHDSHTIGLRSDGTVLAVGDNGSGQCDVGDWTDIVDIAGSEKHTVGLRADGTVVATGDNKNCQCNVDDWTDIVDIVCGSRYTVGLRADGTVVAIGDNKDCQCNVEGWRDIVAIETCWGRTIGLRSNGTVIITESNGDLKQGYPDYAGARDVGNWTDIVSIVATPYNTIGLRSNGTVVAAIGDNRHGQCDISDWSDVVAIAADIQNTIGLRSDGTVIAVGDNGSGQCDVGDWTDIVDIACGSCHTVGLRADGTVVAVGFNSYDGRCNVSEWTEIVAIACGSCHTIGVRADGTVLTAGDNDYGQCNVREWKLFEKLDAQAKADFDNCKKATVTPSTPPTKNERYSVEQEMRQMQHLRAELLAKKLVDRYCEQFNSSLRGKKEWDSFKEQYDEYSRDFMCYLLAFYAVERAKYKTYEKYWRDYLTGDASCTDIRSLISQAEQSLDVRMVIGDVSSGNFEELAAEYKFPYTNSAGVDSSIFVHKYLHAVIKNELVLTYINELNANDIFKELSVDEALAYMKFSTSDDYKGNIFMKVTATNS